MPTPDPRRALSFGRFADAYARWRPGYPSDAVDWMVPPDASRLADVGAGTGKLTAALVERGLVVHAVEPDPAMLAVLRRLVPEAVAHPGSSEALPLADRSVDAVLVADAWHWFEPEPSIAEVRRVLRPGGWLALVWNLVKPVEPWELELAGLDPDRKGIDDQGAGKALRPPFPSEAISTAGWRSTSTTSGSPGSRPRCTPGTPSRSPARTVSPTWRTPYR
jgi:SAM-dependent methyltransferase